MKGLAQGKKNQTNFLQKKKPVCFCNKLSLFDTKDKKGVFVQTISDINLLCMKHDNISS